MVKVYDLVWTQRSLSSKVLIPQLETRGHVSTYCRTQTPGRWQVAMLPAGRHSGPAYTLVISFGEWCNCMANDRKKHVYELPI